MIVCVALVPAKAPSANTNHRIGDVDLRQGAAALKGRVSDAGHRVGNHNFGQSFVTVKRRMNNNNNNNNTK